MWHRGRVERAHASTPCRTTRWPWAARWAAPKSVTVIKATGAIEKVYSVDTGKTVFGTLVLHHWDERSGMHLAPLHPGTFTIHPEHQEHRFTLSNGVAVHEDIFVLSGQPGEDGSVDPPAVYYTRGAAQRVG